MQDKFPIIVYGEDGKYRYKRDIKVRMSEIMEAYCI